MVMGRVNGYCHGLGLWVMPGSRKNTHWLWWPCSLLLIASSMSSFHNESHDTDCCMS